MTLVKVVSVNARTGKTEILNKNITLPTEAMPTAKPVNFSDLEKLIAYAKIQGWI